MFLKEKYNYDFATPMMKQYLDAKIAHPDCFIFFRMGDFYEIFYDDAATCSKILGIALAKRGKTTELLRYCSGNNCGAFIMRFLLFCYVNFYTWK